ncbi:hypothetical protein KOW79_006082 [Hemibagrus wyckioides]|uniref:Uncharacterized protein n=1 Tax=Hemibagrus wyckioides TaxID=337641 RepID=A0A9D3NW37_9TELE|nr:hypothetical protein KOW79_006082 [Hemibagrus wyckioides]
MKPQLTKQLNQPVPHQFPKTLEAPIPEQEERRSRRIPRIVVFTEPCSSTTSSSSSWPFLPCGCPCIEDDNGRDEE